MKLEEILELKPEETLLLVVDIQNDFLKAQHSYVFHDAGNDVSNMQLMVTRHLIPFIIKSSQRKAHVAYVQAHYPEGKFPAPYGKLCYSSPGMDFFLIDRFNDSNTKIFEKSEQDPFTNSAVREYIERNHIKNLIVAGVTVTTCIDTSVQSALLIPNLRVIIPQNCVSYRKKKEKDAQKILLGYSLPEMERVLVIDSGNIRYRELQ